MDSELLKTLEKINDKITQIAVDVAKVNTRVDMLYDKIDGYESMLSRHERECPARKDIEEVRKQIIGFSVKLLVSYIVLALAATSVYAAVQKLF